MNSLAETRRMTAACEECGSPDNRVIFSDGSEHCFSPSCGYHKHATDELDKNGNPKLPPRKKPQESLDAMAEFSDLPPPNAGHSYLKSHRHKGDISLRVIGDDVRQDHKWIVIAMRSPDGKVRNLQRIGPDGKKNNLKGIGKRGLFNRIGDANSKRAWVVEGWATGVSIHIATEEDVYVAFGCDNMPAIAEYVKSIGKEVAICADTNHDAPLMAEQVAAAVGGDLFVPRFPHGISGTDANDLAQKCGIKELRQQIEKNTAPIPPPPDPIEIAAGLTPKDYREFRPDIAKALNISVRQLDREVQERKQELIFAEPPAWPEPVNGVELLESIRTLINRHVSLPDYAATAVALWILMTYMIDEVFTAAILALLSPEKRCGKSTLLTILSRLVFRPLQASNITSAAIYRMIEQHQPTLLVDEFDSFQNSNDELRGILNSGHTRDMAFVIRCVGDDNNPVRFSTFGPKVLAAIGTIAATLEDRSITIQMRRKLVDDKKKRIRRPKPGDAFDLLRQQIVRWTQDNGEGLDKVRIRRPAGLNDRAFDNWMPLFQIAKRINDDWLDKATDAALALAENEAGKEDSKAVLMLKDLRDLFTREDGGQLLATEYILAELVKMDDRPWAEFGKDRKPITSQQMASLLKKYGIRPKLLRPRRPKEPFRGYRLRECVGSFARYLS